MDIGAKIVILFAKPIPSKSMRAIHSVFRLSFLIAVLTAFIPAVANAAVAPVAPTFSTQPTSVASVPAKTVTFKVVAKGTATLTYQWLISTNGGGTFAPMANENPYSGVTTATLSVKSVITGYNGYQFKCKVTNGGGNVTSTPGTLTVATVPIISVQPQPANVVAGNQVTFSVTANSSTELSYQWYKGTTAISEANSSSFTINSASSGDVNSYYVVVSNPAASVKSAVVKLAVSTPPNVTTSPSDQGILAGKTATFKVVATGTATLAYQWQSKPFGSDGGFTNLSNNTTIAGATTASLSVKNVSLGMTGTQFQCVVTNAVGNDTSDPATLSVGSVPVIQTPPMAVSVLAGGTANLTVSAQGSGELSYQWYKGTTPVGENSNTLTLSEVDSTDAGSYTVVITNSIGKVTSKAIIVTITEPAAGVYVGTYSGTLGNKGKIAVVAEDGTAVLIHVATSTVNTDGGNSTGGNLGPISINDDTTFFDITPDGNVSGSVDSTGFNATLQGNDVGNTGVITLTAAPKVATGIQQANAGLYRGTYQGVNGDGSSSEGSLLAILAADGSLFVDISNSGGGGGSGGNNSGNTSVNVSSGNNSDGSGGSDQGATGTINASNMLSFTVFGGKGSGTGTLNPDTDTVTGNFTGGGGHGTFFMQLITPAALANPVQIVGVNKFQDFQQISTTAPTTPAITLYDNAAFNAQVFIAAYPGSDISGLTPTPSLTDPTANVTNLNYSSDSGDWSLGQGFDTLLDMDNTIPAGNYSISVGSLSDGLALTVPADAFPHIPAVTGGTWSTGNLSINARAASTIQFNTFPEYASGGIIQFEIDDVNTTDPKNLQDGNKILHQQNISFYGAPALTSYTIPANTLQPGHLYIAEIGFGAFTTVDQSSLPGTAAIVLFQNHTDFFILTLP